MDNFVYERDYTADRPTDDLDPIEKEAMLAYLHELDQQRREAPKVINLIQKRAFDYLLDLCDTYAKENFGVLRGYIDYEKYDAIIQLTVSCLEFDRETFIDFYTQLAMASAVYFLPTDDGRIRLELLFQYFIPLTEEKL